MKIHSAHIIFANGVTHPKGGMAVEKGDMIASCEIEGGKIDNAKDIDIVFKDCFLEDCEYAINDIERLTQPFIVIDSCIIRNCKLPLGYYVRCTFENEGKREYSIPYS